MGKYSFDYSIDTSGVAKISISNAGIIFSKEAIDLLGYPEKVNIGLDKTKKVLGVRKADENSTIKAFDFVTNPKKRSWLRIQSKQLVSEIGKITRLTYGSESVPYLAKLEEDDGIKFLVVELSKK